MQNTNGHDQQLQHKYIYDKKKVQLSLIMPQRHTHILNLGNRLMSS